MGSAVMLMFAFSNGERISASYPNAGPTHIVHRMHHHVNWNFPWKSTIVGSIKKVSVNCSETMS